MEKKYGKNIFYDLCFLEKPQQEGSVEKARVKPGFKPGRPPQLTVPPWPWNRTQQAYLWEGMARCNELPWKRSLAR